MAVKTFKDAGGWEATRTVYGIFSADGIYAISTVEYLVVGGGGSGGAQGSTGSSGIGAGGAYGGGTATDGGAGATGAVRIIWGAGRAFPSTNTGNL